MNVCRTPLHDAVVDFCTQIGKDPLLVQGAGGNVSFKQNNELWVKASGTWLADAARQDIFVPVDLPQLRSAIARQDFDVTPLTVRDSSLRPSIETLLHALLPHTVVAHLHAIEALAHLVRDDCETQLRKCLADFEDWVVVDYEKPGAPLAAAVAEEIRERPQVSVVFLRNHGVVVGAETVEQILTLLTLLTDRLQTTPIEATLEPAGLLPPETLATTYGPYHRLQNAALGALVFDDCLYAQLRESWALYPDHVVFLGPYALTCDSLSQTLVGNLEEHREGSPIFVKNVGIFVPETFNRARLEQLQCYLDVLARLPRDAPIVSLSKADVADLLDWDAERYRVGSAK